MNTDSTRLAGISLHRKASNRKERERTRALPNPSAESNLAGPLFLCMLLQAAWLAVQDSGLMDDGED